MILLDTSVLIADPLTGLDPQEDYAASILSRAELEFGVAIADGARAMARRRRLDELDQIYEWLPVTPATTRACGILAKAMHAHAPAQARRMDTYIAAHALEWGVPLMTANPKDLHLIAYLVTIIPWPAEG